MALFRVLGLCLQPGRTLHNEFGSRRLVSSNHTLPHASWYCFLLVLEYEMSKTTAALWKLPIFLHCSCCLRFVMGGSKADEYNEMSLDIVSDSRDVPTDVISLHPKACSCLYKGKNICCQDYCMPRIRCFTAYREILCLWLDVFKCCH